ncbi:hypothetical protein D3C87_2076510 [compost metagenome]
MLGREFFDDFCPTLCVRTVIFNYDFEWAPIDTAFIIDDFGGSFGNALIPATVRRANASAVELHADLDRFGRLRL